MIPSRFRMLPRHDRIEMMAHIRERNIRKGHFEKVRQAVDKEMDEEEKRKRPR